MSTRLTDVEMQLAELEMLRSMYPNETDIILCDMIIHSELQKFVEGDSNDPLRLLVFVVKMQLQERNCKFEVEFSPPLHYPSNEKISVLIRSSNLNKTQYANINGDLKCYIQDLEIGDPQILQVIEWINEHGQSYVDTISNNLVTEENRTREGPEQFSRIWIYSHHIYNKTKRKNILEWSKELALTGFSMPGKPGVVCVEGPSKNCEEFWLRMRRQTWKRLSLVHREDGIMEPSSGVMGTFVSKFCDQVSEIEFGVHGGRDYHMDLGKFAAFLAEHQSHDVFSILFGVEGKINDEK